VPIGTQFYNFQPLTATYLHKLHTECNLKCKNKAGIIPLLLLLLVNITELFHRFALKSWAAQDSLLRTLVESLYEKWQADETFHPWENYIVEGQELLQGQQVSFNRPRQETDRLFMNIGGDDVIEMQHPPVPADTPGHQRPGKPMLRLGAIASGKPLIKEDQLRLEFAARHQCIGTDTEFDQVTVNLSINQSLVCISQKPVKQTG